MSRLNYGEMFDRRCAELIFRFQVNDLERRTFNTTFSTIAILVTWKFFQAMWFRSFYSIHGFKAFSFSLAFHVRPVFSYGILGIYSNYKAKTCLSGRLGLPSVANSNHWVLLQAYIDVSECPLRNHLHRCKWMPIAQSAHQKLFRKWCLFGVMGRVKRKIGS